MTSTPKDGGGGATAAAPVSAAAAAAPGTPAAVAGAAAPVRYVELDALVVLKIIKHCKEQTPDVVTGQLLGLEVGERLEVTDAFAFPAAVAGGDEDSAHDRGRYRDEREARAAAAAAAADKSRGAGLQYQYEMMRCLREVNVDNNTVGWYRSTSLGAFLDDSVVAMQFQYQTTIAQCVLLVYDPLKTTHGTLALRAYRLAPAFLQLYAAKRFTKASLAASGVSHASLFEELPVRVHNSLLTDALLAEVDACGATAPGGALAPHHDKLDLASGAMLERTLQRLVDCVDELASENGHIQYHQRQLARQQQQQQAWLSRRRQENVQRRAQGLDELPEDDPDAPAAKPLHEPSRLDSLLITSQIETYCEQIEHFTGQTLTKLFLIDKLTAEQRDAADAAASAAAAAAAAAEAAAAAGGGGK